MSWRPIRVSPYLFAAHLTSSEVRSDFQIWFSDADEASTIGSLSRHLDTKFIIGFDFAVTLSSPASFCVLFDIGLGLLNATEMADVKQTQKMIPFITCEISLCQHVCDLVLGVNVFDLDFLSPN